MAVVGALAKEAGAGDHERVEAAREGAHAARECTPRGAKGNRQINKSKKHVSVKKHGIKGYRRFLTDKAATRAHFALVLPLIRIVSASRCECRLAS